MAKSEFLWNAFLIGGILLNGMNAHAQKEKAGEQLPAIPEMPSIPAAKAENSIMKGQMQTAITRNVSAILRK